MVTFLSGGTGTPKLLDGSRSVFPAEETTVVVNTGDDIELGGLFVTPDIDTVLFQGGGVLDRSDWWGIEDDTFHTHDALDRMGDRIGADTDPVYLSDDRQVSGRDIAKWRRFSGVPEFMRIGDRDRAVHLVRTSLIDRGYSLTEVTDILARGFDLTLGVLPMSDDPVATIVHTTDGSMHFQEYWVHRGGEPVVEEVEYRGSSEAKPTERVMSALADHVVIGPSNPVTSIGPITALDGVRDALESTTVIVVSPFGPDGAFSGPTEALMAGIGHEPSVDGLDAMYPFADAFVIDTATSPEFDRPIVETDLIMNGPRDATRIARAIDSAIAEVT